jgi:hypothetical protein
MAPPWRRRAFLALFLLVLATVALVPLVLFHASAAVDPALPGARGARAAAGDLARGAQPLAADAAQLDAQFGAGREAAPRVQQTNRTPLAHETATVAERQASLGAQAANATAGSDGPRASRPPPPAESAAALPASPGAAPDGASPAQAQASSAPRPEHVAEAAAGSGHAHAQPAGCGGHGGAQMTPWDEPAETSTAGDACSVHSDALNAVFHQRFEFAPGALQIGGAYDSEHCYTYEGDECWVVRERQPHAGPCGTPDTDGAPPLDDAGAADAAPERHKLLWQLRRAAHLGRLSAPEEEGAEEDEEAFGARGAHGYYGVGASWKMGGSFVSGPWGRRALDVVVDAVAAAEWESVSVLLHGNELGALVEDAAAQLPSPLVFYSAVTPAALDAHVARSEARAQAAALTALHALAPDKVQRLLHSAALRCAAIVDDVPSLGPVSLPHEFKTTLGSVLLLSHLTVLPMQAVEEVGELLGAHISVQELIESCVAHVDPHAKVSITTKRRDVVLVTLLRSQARRFSAVDLDHELCAAAAGEGSRDGGRAGAGADTGGQGAGADGYSGDGAEAWAEDREQAVRCKEEEEYELHITESCATLYPAPRASPQRAQGASAAHKGLGNQEAAGTKAMGGKSSKETQDLGHGSALR